MKCPACENELSELKIAGIQVHVCLGSCGGLWFPFTQLKKAERVKPGSGSALLHIERAEGLKVYRGAEHPCPYCKTTLLYRHFFSRDWDTEVDQCSKCSGFWVDAGGLAKLLGSSGANKRKLHQKYLAAIINEKIGGMNLINEDVAQAAKLITAVFRFLSPD